MLGCKSALEREITMAEAEKLCPPYPVIDKRDQPQDDGDGEHNGDDAIVARPWKIGTGDRS